VYVADQAANKIKVWGKDGTFVGAFSRAGTKLGQLQRPQGVELGPDGHLYVAEQGNERITDFSITPI
jgi:DNA-binding beta-propeller fold protein YncE